MHAPLTEVTRQRLVRVSGPQLSDQPQTVAARRKCHCRGRSLRYGMLGRFPQRAQSSGPYSTLVKLETGANMLLESIRASGPFVCHGAVGLRQRPRVQSRFSQVSASDGPDLAALQQARTKTPPTEHHAVHTSRTLTPHTAACILCIVCSVRDMTGFSCMLFVYEAAQHDTEATNQVLRDPQGAPDRGFRNVGGGQTAC
jgi:hypothetical protein